MSYDRPPLPLPVTKSAIYERPPVPPPYTEGSEDLSQPNSPPQLPPRPPADRLIITRLSHQATTNVPNLPVKEDSESDSEMLPSIDANNIFSSPISTNEPLAMFSRDVHPVSIPSDTYTFGKAVPTNKFYGNMMLADQTNPVWTHPYSLWLTRGCYFGVSVSYTTASQRVFGSQSPPQYYFAPTGIQSIVFSSKDIASPSELTLGFTNITHLSVLVQLKKNDTQFISFPLVQGMGFVTAVYHNLIPRLFSAVGFRQMTALVSPRFEIQKYKLELNNGVCWMLYVTVPTGQSLSLALESENVIVGNRRVNDCVFQIVADTNPAIDVAAGCFPISCKLSGFTRGSKGSYKLTYVTSGSSNGGKTLMYALPHQVQSFSAGMMNKRINSLLDSTVYGKMVGYITDVFDMEVVIPSKLGFDPFSTIQGKSEPSYSVDVLRSITSAASQEVMANVVDESNLDSMYFAGKVLAKYAWILYCCQYVLKDKSLVSILMPKLKEAFKRFVSNKQKLPLKYDTTWGGIISSGSSSQDFGNSHYNDHHFHYAYHVITAAILAKVDRDSDNGNWLPQNRHWVENLIRDFSNPNESDPYFPEFRSFDWFAGHSWAKGLFPSGDGKDQESSSEDANAAYALKLWGSVAGCSNLESIGLLELGIMKVSNNSYFLYSDDNTTQPLSFIPNKVSGIFFENKIDHTTYFGNKLIYIQMIHAIPITPASSFIRTPTFVEQEWKQMLEAIADDVTDGWKGILMLNAALFDPKLSYTFFDNENFTSNYLDDGQSRTWSLTYSGVFA